MTLYPLTSMTPLIRKLKLAADEWIGFNWNSDISGVDNTDLVRVETRAWVCILLRRAIKWKSPSGNWFLTNFVCLLMKIVISPRYSQDVAMRTCLLVAPHAIHHPQFILGNDPTFHTPMSVYVCEGCTGPLHDTHDRITLNGRNRDVWFGTSRHPGRCCSFFCRDLN